MLSKNIRIVTNTLTDSSTSSTWEKAANESPTIYKLWLKIWMLIQIYLKINSTRSVDITYKMIWMKRNLVNFLYSYCTTMKLQHYIRQPLVLHKVDKLVMIAYKHVKRYNDYECRNSRGERFRLTYDPDTKEVSAYAELKDNTYTLQVVSPVMLRYWLESNLFLKYE